MWEVGVMAQGESRQKQHCISTMQCTCSEISVSSVVRR